MSLPGSVPWTGSHGQGLQGRVWARPMRKQLLGQERIWASWGLGQSWGAQAEPGIGCLETEPALCLAGPVPKNLALQLVSSLPSAQLAIPSHTESGSRQTSWSQGNSS